MTSRWKGLCSLVLIMLAVVIGSAHWQSEGSIVGWGEYVVVEQAAVENLISVAGGEGHSLGLRSDGTIVAWGWNIVGQCDVPPPNTDFVAVAGGYDCSLGLKGTPAVSVEEPRPRPAPGASALAIRSLTPNPFSPFLVVSFDNRASSLVTMTVHGVDGRLVRTVPLGWLESGLHRVRWDGRDGYGRSVCEGVYMIRLRSMVGATAAVKATLVR